MRRCLRSELPLLVMAVYLPRIQILVAGSDTQPGSRFGGPGAARKSKLPGVHRDAPALRPENDPSAAEGSAGV
jgi:hypothetical protein